MDGQPLTGTPVPTWSSFSFHQRSAGLSQLFSTTAGREARTTTSGDAAAHDALGEMHVTGGDVQQASPIGGTVTPAGFQRTLQ